MIGGPGAAAARAERVVDRVHPVTGGARTAERAQRSGAAAAFRRPVLAPAPRPRPEPRPPPRAGCPSPRGCPCPRRPRDTVRGGFGVVAPAAAGTAKPNWGGAGVVAPAAAGADGVWRGRPGRGRNRDTAMGGSGVFAPAAAGTDPSSSRRDPDRGAFGVVAPAAAGTATRPGVERVSLPRPRPGPTAFWESRPCHGRNRDWGSPRPRPEPKHRDG